MNQTQIPKQIIVKENIPRWEKQSQQGWRSLWKDLDSSMKKVRNKEVTTNHHQFTYMDIISLTLVLILSVVCIVGTCKLLMWMWTL